ncbi:MAG: AAA family ATPase [Rhodopila sp.]
MPAWQVIAENRALGHFEALRSGLTPMVGREEEIDLLLRRWTQAKGSRGRAVLISAEAGVGKSRLAEVLAERLAPEPHLRLRYFCSPHHQDSALYPVITQMERAAGFTRGDASVIQLAKLQALLAIAEPSSEDVALIAELHGLSSANFAPLLGLTPQRKKDMLFAALLRQVEALARQQPVLMVFDDIHWIDPSSQELLDRTIERVAGWPVLLLALFRPEFQPPWVGQPHVTMLTLARLGRRDTAAMVANVAGNAPLSGEIVEEIAERTDGVPLFVEELTKTVLEAGVQAPAALSAFPHPGLSVPATLQASLMARFDRLPAAKQVAQAGSVIGREFSHALVAAIAGLPEAALAQGLDELVRKSGLVFCRGLPPDAVYSFKHALVKDAAYDSLLKGRRQELHRKLASVFEQRHATIQDTEPELLAHHYTQARQFQKAIPLWLQAGKLALKRIGLAEAIKHLERGLDLIAALPPSVERDGRELDMRTLLGTVWIALKGWAAQEVWNSLYPSFELARALNRNDILLPILWGLYIHVFCRGRVAESLHWVTQILDAAEACHDRTLLILGHQAATDSWLGLGELIKARDHAGRALELYGEADVHLVDLLNQDPRTIASALAASCTWMLGYPEQAIAINNAKDIHARQRGHPFNLGWALTTGAMVFDHLREPKELLKRIEEAERVGRDNSLPVVTEILVPVFSGFGLIRLGQLETGIASLKRGIAAWEMSGGRVLSPYFKSVLTEGMAQSGDLDGALDLLEEIIVQIERPGWEERRSYAETLRIKGWVLSLKGDAAGAEQNYRASLDWARHQQAKSWELRTVMSLARLWQSQGRRQEAYELLAPVYGWFTEGFATADLQDAKVLMGELRAQVRLL